MEGVTQFLVLIYSMRMQVEGKDILIWTKDRMFCVNLYYNFLYAKTRVDFLTKEI